VEEGSNITEIQGGEGPSSVGEGGGGVLESFGGEGQLGGGELEWSKFKKKKEASFLF